MNQDLMDCLACPSCRGKLRFQDGTFVDNRVENGTLECPSCQVGYSIHFGIPSFLGAADTVLTDVQEKEVRARDQIYQARGKNFQVPVNRYPVLDAIRSAIGDCHGLRVLDAGCGNGQTMEALRLPSRLVAMDFSWSGLVNFNAGRSMPELDLVHADGAHMPFADAAFDVVLSAEVLQHLPTEELRGKFINEMARVLGPGGKCILVAYNWSRGWQEDGIPKEGTHENGIFYHAFDAEELRRLLGREFKVKSVVGVRVQLPKTHGLLRRVGALNVYWDRLWRRTAIGVRYSHLLLAHCQRCEKPRYRVT